MLSPLALIAHMTRCWRAILSALLVLLPLCAAAQRVPLPDALLQDAWRALPALEVLRGQQTDPRALQAYDQRLALLHAELGELLEAQQRAPMGPIVQPVTGPVVVLDGVVPRLLAQAAERRLVMVNESHHRPQSRALTLALLPGLYAAGYRYLALEALAADDSAALARRGFPENQTGGFIREPVFGELVREALRLGYRLIPYDAPRARSMVERENLQAQRLFAATFARDPDARVLVHGGYAHVFETIGFLGEAEPLAMQLGQRTGYDPLTIDQTLAHGDPRGRAHPRHAEWLQQCALPPCLLATAEGTPLALPRRMTDWVLLNAEGGRSERPNWLGLGGLRRAVASPAAWLCQAALPCLVEARLADESARAVPVDRCVVRAAGDCPVLWLRAGSDYRLKVRGPDGSSLRQLLLRVAHSGADART